MNLTRRKQWIIGPAVALLTACGAHGTGEPEHRHEAEDTHAAEATVHDDEIVWAETSARAAGVRVETVNPGAFRAVYKTSGAILAAAGDERVVSATSAGVVRLPAGGFADGAPVRSGQVLAWLSARELTDGDPAEKARLDYEAALRELKRAEALAADRLISDRQLEEARLRQATAKAAWQGTAGRLDEGGLKVVAPMSGYVKQCLVAPGEFVNVGQPLLILTQNRRLRLRAEVPEEQAAALTGVQSARFRTASSDGVLSLDSLHGRLLSVGRAVAPGAFWLPVTFEFDNVGALLPGSYAEVWLLDAVRADVLALPCRALTEEQGLYFVYVQEAPDRYRRQEVTLGADDGSRVEIVSGLRGGERVVTEGALRVKLAGTTAAIPAHNHEH